MAPNYREERKRIAGVNVVLSWPSEDEPVKGVTFLLPGAMISISEYNGLRDVILMQNYLVVSFYINVLWPVRNNHRKHAQDVKNVFDYLLSSSTFSIPNKYFVVGHSAGGKIALLLISVVDPERVTGVVSLDPVDINPVEFSRSNGRNLPLNDDDEPTDSEIICTDSVSLAATDLRKRNRKMSPIVLTCTDGGSGIPKSHNADAIHKLHPATTIYRHEHAGHMSYCDNGGGWARYLMPDIGTKEGNQMAKASAHDLIRQILGGTSEKNGNA